jgi:thioredoxin reductase (NADPH)
MLDLAIIGGGPAGLSAGLYATRGGLKSVAMYEKGLPGGAIASSSEIENYPGVGAVQSGMEFMDGWIEQCMRFGLKHEMKEIKRVSKNGDIFDITFSNGDLTQAKTVIVCTGSTPKRAGFQGEKEFFGRGISTCATCDGFFYKDKEVAVIGGGDTALEEALYLANICSKVYLIHRRDQFRAAPSTIEKVKNNPKIELVVNSIIQEVYGDNMGVSGIKIEDKKTNEITDLSVPGVFIFVGTNVNNQVLMQEDGNFLCQTNEWGEIIVDLKMNTNVSGLYVAGDMRIDAAKQVVCAASDGAIAALQAIEHLNC